MAEISLKVNGETFTVECDPATPLLYVLRNQLNLVGQSLVVALNSVVPVLC